MRQPAEEVEKTAETFERELDGEVVLLELRSQTYYSMNETGTAIWRAINEGVTSKQKLVECLLTEFEGGRAQVSSQVESFLKELAEEGLIRIVSA